MQRQKSIQKCYMYSTMHLVVHELRTCDTERIVLSLFLYHRGNSLRITTCLKGGQSGLSQVNPLPSPSSSSSLLTLVDVNTYLGGQRHYQHGPCTQEYNINMRLVNGSGCTVPFQCRCPELCYAYMHHCAMHKNGIHVCVLSYN